MRGLVGLGFIGVLLAAAIVFYMASGGPSGNDSFSVALAAGKVPSGAFELHVGVEFGMTRIEGPKLKGPGSTWPEWVNEHFKLVDAAGKAIPLNRTNHSRLMKGPGTWDFFLSAPATPGATYTLTYKPKRDETSSYRHTFTIPSTGMSMVRELFKPT